MSDAPVPRAEFERLRNRVAAIEADQRDMLVLLGRVVGAFEALGKRQLRILELMRGASRG